MQILGTVFQNIAAQKPFGASLIVYVISKFSCNIFKKNNI